MATPVAKKRATKILNDFTEFTQKPEDFLGLQTALAKKLKSCVKELYDLSKRIETESVGDALPELIISNFDDEQVWQEIELQNDPSINRLLPKVAQLITSKSPSFDIQAGSPSGDKLETSKQGLEADHDNESNDSEEEEEEEEKSEDGEEDSGEDIDLFGNVGGDIEEDESEEEKELKELLKRVTHQKVMDSDDEDEEEEEELEPEEDSDPEISFSTKKSRLQDKTVEDSQKDKKSNMKRKTVVDDKFFKLADMELFLEQEDAKEELKIHKEEKGGQDEEDSSEEEEIDLFADIPSEDEEDKKSMKKSGRELRYKDFFDPPEQSSEPKKKKVPTATLR